MAKDIVKEAVNKFLDWKFPSDFSPDGGIHFRLDTNFTLTGTNLLNADQAKEMFEYCLADIAEQEHIGIATQSAYLGDLEEAIIAMAEDGWLYFGSEGMSVAQKKCYDAYMLINPIPKYKASLDNKGE